MPKANTIMLERPIGSVRILSDRGTNTDLPPTVEMNPAAGTGQIESSRELQEQKNLYTQLCQTLQGLTAKLSQFYDEIFVGHKEEIAKLSLEIARKILIQKVQDGDYEIEAIIKEALKNAPTQQSLTVRLNPEDLALCQKAQRNDDDGALAGIELVADANVGRAECVVQSPKGIINSLIDEHLEQISKALKKTE